MKNDPIRKIPAGSFFICLMIIFQQQAEVLYNYT
ncbi:hypothetical protein JOD18_002651 [Gracilibacillus alcaliphilus]|nr:hypothetical protein [Gracilibacillus alcaliphilus]